MDSITHLALGACMGEAIAGNKIGKKAMLFGAVAQSIPDIDFIVSLWLDTSSGLLAHRGFTHSFLFCALIIPLLAWLAFRLHAEPKITFSKWIIFFSVIVISHILIDAFNNYGVGWFEPFNHQRISFHAIYVADPFFSLWPVLSCIALIYLKKGNLHRKKWWKMGLLLSGMYLFYCLWNKAVINKDVKEILKQQEITYTKYFTTPAPFQSWLWYVVAADDSGYYTGYRSVFDSKNEICFQYFKKNDSLLLPFTETKVVKQLIRFSQDYYRVEKWKDTLMFNDLRFGQIMGWENARAKFVFYYYLQQPGANALVVQRGRFEGWNWSTARTYLIRIAGN